MKLRVLSIAAIALITTMSWATGPNAADSQAAFARLKSLAGEWEGTVSDGSKSHLRYEIISGGSAVVEHFVNDKMGAANAMVTVFYLNGARLELTHYCMAKNQPHMQAEAFDSSTGELRFGFVNATGLSGPEAGHMHNASFKFIDADHFSADWQFYESGKPKFNENVQFTRVQ